MQLEPEIFKWLYDNKIISDDATAAISPEGKVELDEETSATVQNGTIFIRLIRILKRYMQISSPAPIQTPPNLFNMKDNNTIATRLYNWNIIVECLAKFHHPIDNDIKNLIVKGDEETALEVLKEVYNLIMDLAKV